MNGLWKSVMVVLVVTALGMISATQWKGGIFYGDALGYHAYLPATFVHNNLLSIEALSLDTTIAQGIRDGISRWPANYSVNSKGHVIPQYTYGISLLNAPFWVMAHGYASITGSGPANGFGTPYIIAIRLAGLFYSLMGFYFLWLVAKKYIEEHILIFIVFASVCFGTNLYWFTFIQAGMAHTQLFFLYSALIFFSDKYWVDIKDVKWFWALALTLGFLVLIRPSEAIAVLIPLLYNMTSLRERLATLTSISAKTWAIGVFLGLMPLVPQLIYWYFLTGSPLYYSYGEQGFDWTTPHIVEGLIGSKNGWVTYTPLALLMIVCTYIPKSKLPTTIATQMLLPIYLYVTFAWWNYFYINGFGSRPMIHIYGLLAIPILGALQNSSPLKKSILFSFIMIATGVNLRYSQKMLNGTLISEESSHQYNFHTFFTNQLTYQDLVLKDIGIKQYKFEKCSKVSTVGVDDSTSYQKYFDPQMQSYLIDSLMEYAPFSADYILNDDTNNTWIQAQGIFMAPTLVHYTYYQPQLVITVERNGKNIVWKSIRINNKIGKDGKSQHQISACLINKWGNVSFNIEAMDLRKNDKIKVIIWNPEHTQLWVSEVSLSLCSR